jgi:hypothetical protein
MRWFEGIAAGLEVCAKPSCFFFPSGGILFVDRWQCEALLASSRGMCVLSQSASDVKSLEVSRMFCYVA